MTTHIQFSPGDYLAPAVDWLNTNLHGLFKGISQVIEAVLGAVEGRCLLPIRTYSSVLSSLRRSFLPINESLFSLR